MSLSKKVLSTFGNTVVIQAQTYRTSGLVSWLTNFTDFSANHFANICEKLKTSSKTTNTEQDDLKQ